MPVQSKAPVQPKVPIEPEASVESEAAIQEAEETTVESVSALETESDQGHGMVTRRMMTISRFMPSTRPAAQQ